MTQRQVIAVLFLFCLFTSSYTQNSLKKICDIPCPNHCERIIFNENAFSGYTQTSPPLKNKL